jgi:hypothetical protein
VQKLGVQRTAGERSRKLCPAQLLSDCCRAQLPMGIVTTTSRGNVEALLKFHPGADARATRVSLDQIMCRYAQSPWGR